MRAHTITTNAWAGGRGRRKRTVVPGGILALSLAVVLLAATASTASADRPVRVSLDPASVGFGDRQVGTTTAQAFTLNLRCKYARCSTTFNPRISVSREYAQTNNCPPTVPQSPYEVSCTINVTFAPTSTGSKGGTLSTGKGICHKRPHRSDQSLEPCAGPTATLTGNGVTTPTPPTPPLTLAVDAASRGLVAGPPVKKIGLIATTNHDSTLVARGDVKRTVVQLAAGETTHVEARLKHQRRLDEKLGPGGDRPTVKVKAKATDEFGQTAHAEIKTKLRSGY